MADLSTLQTTILSTAKSMNSPSSHLQSLLQRSVMYFDPGNEKLDHDVAYMGHDNRDYLLVGLVHTIGLILSIVGNFSVIVIIARTNKLHTPSSLLVLVLATSDLLLSFFWNLVPLLLTFNNEVNRIFLEDGIACDVIGFAWQTMLTISTLSHAIVAFDRFLFIVHPMKYQVYVTVKASSVLTCVIIGVAFLLSALTFIIRSDFRFHQLAGMCIESPIWSLLYLFLVFLPSLSVALFAYQRIWRLCASIFKQEDIVASRGHSPYLHDSNQLPPLTLSVSRNKRISDQSAKSDAGDFKVMEGMEQKSQNKSVDNELQTGAQQEVLTTVTTHHTTKVTRKNTTTTTTIANTTSGSEVPVEDPCTHQDDIHLSRTFDRKISEVTEVEVEKTTSTSLKRKRTYSQILHIGCPGPEPSLEANSQVITNETIVQISTHPSGSIEPASSDSQKMNSKGKRSSVQDSIASFLSRKHRQGQNPFIVTTSAESISNNSSMDVNISTVINGPSFPAKNPIHLDTTPPFQHTSYESVNRKLFGSEAVLPSLLYVAILMPLSMQPVSSNYRRRRLRVCLLIGLPVLIMAVSFLPFPGSLIYLGFMHAQDSIGGGGGMFLIKLICHLTYALVPSLTSLLLCLNNKPYRRALRQTCRCQCV